MTSLRYDPGNYEETTALPQQGGCLSGFILPPLMVMLLGTVMAFVLLSASPATTTVRAADASQGISAPAASGENTLSMSMSLSSGGISPIFRPEVQYWEKKIQVWADQAGLDPNLVATVMQIESCGYQKALSRAGALGLFQVMPYHFAAGDNPYDPDTNAKRGMDYLKRSMEAANGNVRLALAGYNGGIGVIGQPESSWASQTQGYVYYGSKIYADATNTPKGSADVQEWSNSGSALCQKAAAMEGINP